MTARCKVYGSRPNSGPTSDEAYAGIAAIGRRHRSWDMSVDTCTPDATVFKAWGPTADELEKALKSQFPRHRTSTNVPQAD